MTDEETMLAAYAAHGGNPTARLILADWYEERGDPRGPWLRDPDLGALMGLRAENPIPKLVAKCGTKKAAKLLRKIGRAAVPELLLAWAEWGNPNRDAARAILADLAASDTELAKPIAQLKSTDPRDQRAGLAALGRLGEFGMAAVAPILDLLKDERGDIRAEAVRTLAKLGPAADAALLAANRSMDYNDRDTATVLHEEAVKRGPNSPAIRVLTRDLGRSGDIAESASNHLHELGGGAFEAILEGVLHADSDREHWFTGAARATPDADARLLAVARDRTRDGDQRAFAIKALVNSFHDDPPEEDRNWVIPHLIEFTDDPSPAAVEAAVFGLLDFGERAASAVPALVRLLDRLLAEPPERSDDSIIHALAAIGPAAAVAIDRIRTLRNVEGYSSAAEYFLKRVRPAEDHSADIRTRSVSRDADTRATAWHELARMHDPPSDLPDLLERGLADRVAVVRQAAAQAIFRDEWQKQPGGLAFVRKHLAHRDSVIRSLIAGGIPYSEGVRTELLPDVLARLKVEPNANVREKLLEGLRCPFEFVKGLPAFTSAAVRDAVKAALADPMAAVRAAAVVVVQMNWEHPPAELLPALLRVIRQDRKMAGSHALEVLRKVPSARPQVVAILRKRLATERGRWRLEGTLQTLNQLGYRPTKGERLTLLRAIRAGYSAADDAIEMLGRCGRVAVPDLIALLAEGVPAYHRASAAKALQTIGPPARAAVPALQALFDADDSRTPEVAVQALAIILPRDELIDALRPAIRSRRTRARQAVLRVAKDFGPDARPWLPELLHLARAEELGFDSPVSELLAGFVRKSPTLLAEVLPLLDEPAPAVENALRVIAAIGPRAKKAEPKLRELKAEWDGPSGWLDTALKAVQDNGPKR